MQRRLRHTAEKDPEHQFGDLYSLLCHGVWLRVAVHHVQQNKGSETAGIDGKTMAHFRGNFDGYIEELKTTLKAETFEPCPVRRVYIPKPNSDKKRPLGVPILFDRIVQEALRMILEPIWEADFSVHSYGFRPNKSTYDAIAYIGNRLKGNGSSYQWVIEGDIKSYFDTIPHRRLIKAVKKRVADRKIRDLLWKFLRAGVMHRGQFEETLTGTPQGGIVTPPTKLQTFFFGIRIASVRIDPKHDIDLIPGYFHPLHQGPDEIPLARPVGCLQSAVDFGRKIFESANNQLEFRLQGRLIRPRLTLLFQASEALTEAGNPGLELVLVDEALRIAVKQPGDAVPELADLCFHRGQGRAFGP